MSYACSSLLLLLAPTAFAQDALTARQILERVRDTYTNVRQFDIAGALELTNPRVRVPFRLVYQYPDKLRMEGSMGGPGAQSGGTVITDGRTTWNYDAELNTYTRQAGPPDLDLDMGDDELAQLGIDPSSPAVVKFAEMQLATYRKLATLAGSATLLRTDTVQLAGIPVECYVVETQEKPPTKEVWWIDTRQYRILRMEGTADKSTMRLNFNKVSLNVSVRGTTG